MVLMTGARKGGTAHSQSAKKCPILRKSLQIITKFFTHMGIVVNGLHCLAVVFIGNIILVKRPAWILLYFSCGENLIARTKQRTTVF
jgi:hypothetical protein